MLWIGRFDTLDELRTAVRTFGRTYNQQWLIERHGYRTPTETREHRLREGIDRKQRHEPEPTARRDCRDLVEERHVQRWSPVASSPTSQGIEDERRDVTDPRVERYAELLLDTCLGVQRGWQVMVWSTPWARPLLEEIMRQLGIRSAYPLLRLTFGGGLVYHRAWLTHAPLEVISEPASIDVYALEHCDAFLSIAAPENTDDGAAAAGVGLGADIGEGRTSAVRRAYRPPGARLHRDEVPGVLCWCPTPALAGTPE